MCMTSKKTLLLTLVSGSVFLILDQWLKWQSLHAWDKPVLLTKWFGWYPFLNPGVAFSIPLPQPLVVLITVPLVVLMVWQVVRLYRRPTQPGAQLQMGAFEIIIAGAVSNIIDRLAYQSTIDFFLITTGVINIGDMLIVLGFILLFLSFKNER